MIKHSLSLIKLSLLSLFLIFSSNLYAEDGAHIASETVMTTTQQTPDGPVVVQRHVIITNVPAAKQVYDTPNGYISCATVPAAWVDNNWIPSHKVCTYDNDSKGVAWVDGYWSCTKYKPSTGECTNWNWVDAHWVTVYSVY